MEAAWTSETLEDLDLKQHRPALRAVMFQVELDSFTSQVLAVNGM
jgi:hypothetical protein